MHRDVDRNSLFTARDGRKFGFAVGTAFFVVAGVLAWRGHGFAAYTSAALGAFLVATAVGAPARLDPIHRAWMTMAMAISKLTTPVFMTLIYFVVLTPTGALRRMIGRNPLRRNATADSYWIARSAVRHGDLRRQF